MNKTKMVGTLEAAVDWLEDRIASAPCERTGQRTRTPGCFCDPCMAIEWALRLEAIRKEIAE